jgi:cell volume regulation protein A
MLGSILGGSSSVVIMPAMALAKLEGRVTSLVSLESAFTDVFCVVGASVTIQLLSAEASGMSPGLALAQSFGIALAVGFGAGFLWVIFMERLGGEHAYTFTLAALMALYVLVEQLEGSSALAVLTFAVVLGNAPSLGRFLHIVREPRLGTSVTLIHSQVSFIIKSFFFTFMGLMLGPPWPLFALGVGAGIGLYLVRRVAVRVALAGRGWDLDRRRLVASCLPRGLAAGVLATLPAAAGVPDTADLPPFVFAAVVTSIAVFAIAFPRARKRLAAGASASAQPPPSESSEPPPSVVVSS